MSKTLAWLTTVVLTAVFLFFIFGLVAALDEFARIPFYGTLPLAAFLVNGIGLVFWRRGAQRGFAGFIYSPFAVVRRAVLEPVVAAVGGLKPDHNLCPSVRHIRGSEKTQEEEISAAVAKIHSVAWWLPASVGRVPENTQETMNHEAHS